MPKINMQGLISRRSYERRVNQRMLSSASNLAHRNKEDEKNRGTILFPTQSSSLTSQTVSNSPSVPELNLINIEINETNISDCGSLIDDDSASSADESPCPTEFRENLRVWAIKNNITHVAVNNLLEILRPVGGQLGLLPKDARTLLETAKAVERKICPPGEYWHRGLYAALVENLSLLEIPCDVNTIKLQINVDGLPVSNSSKGQFWPILGRVTGLIDKPFVIGLYYGHSKPESVEDFLRAFLDEAKTILQAGVIIGTTCYQLKIDCIICDAPARAFLKGIIGHNGYCGCERCNVIGEYSHVSHHVTYIGTNYTLRTDDSFRKRNQLKHHKTTSPLEELPIDMVKDFVLDYMHLFLPGMQKFLLKCWMKGTASFKSKLSAMDMHNISERLIRCNAFLPKEIQRRIRPLDVISFWKATEFRCFLLKTGPVVLQDILPLEAYNHFMLLHCAVVICSCKHFLRYIKVAERLFTEVVERFSEIYGDENVTYTVHNIIHVIDDVKRFGTLDSYSAFSFESKLGQIKRLLRSGNKPLQQVAMRILEQNAVEPKEAECPKIGFQNPINQNHSINGCKGVFLKYVMHDMTLSSSCKNRWIVAKCNTIVKIINFTEYENKPYIYGCALKNKTDFYETPISSSKLLTFQSDLIEVAPKLWNVDDIKCKLFCIEKSVSDAIFLPILHTITSL